MIYRSIHSQRLTELSQMLFGDVVIGVFVQFRKQSSKTSTEFNKYAKEILQRIEDDSVAENTIISSQPIIVKLSNGKDMRINSLECFTLAEVSKK